MWIRSKLIVSSVFVLFTSITINAKEIPITQEVELTIPMGKFSVIEFPFKIESQNITSFLIEQSSKKNDEKAKEEIINKPVTQKDNNGNLIPSKKEKSKYISILQNTNSFTFFPKKEGVLKMVIWGYKHPILLTLKASKEDGYASYQFVIPFSESKEVELIEQAPHEKIINDIMVHLFNQTLLKGYKNNSSDEMLESNGYTLRLNRRLIGKKYLGEEWILSNNSKEQGSIHEESFYQNGVYGVSLEADAIDINQSIRVFIVRSNANKKAE